MKIYRSRNGMILGVCKGLEDSLGIPARYFRILMIIAAVLFRAWFILALYLLAALLIPIESSEKWNFQENFEALSKDTRKKVSKEYAELLDSIRKSRERWGHSSEEEPLQNETSDKKSREI